MLVSFTSSSPDAGTGLDDARNDCRSALALAQRLARQSGKLPALWFVTTNAVSAASGDGCAGFAQSPVLGLARTIATELPDLACATVDIGGAGDVAALADEIIHSDGEDRVALRGGIRYVPRLSRVVQAARATRAATHDPGSRYTGGIADRAAATSGAEER